VIHHHYLTDPRSRYTYDELQRSILLPHEFIFCFSCDEIQRLTLFSFLPQSTYDWASGTGPLLFYFFSNPQRSQCHAVDDTMHCSITERCFSYILDHRLTYFPGIHRWASKSSHRPWLWRWRKSKGALSDINSQFRWQQREHVACHKKLIPFWALLLALKYLPYLLDEATRSEELVTLAKMWSYRPFLLSLFPHDAKKVGKAVRHYLARFDGKERRESVAVGPPLLSIV